MSIYFVSSDWLSSPNFAEGLLIIAITVAVIFGLVALVAFSHLKKPYLELDAYLTNKFLADPKVDDAPVSPIIDSCDLEQRYNRPLPSLTFEDCVSLGTDKEKAEAAVKSLYKRDGLAAPLIIWTQSPMANVFAKAGIDFLGKKDVSIPLSVQYHGQFTQNNRLRARAWQSVYDAGWSVGSIGTGPEAWNNLRIYEHRDDICWKYIPPASRFERRNDLRNMLQSNGWFLVGDIVADRSNEDWLIDLWAWIGFAKKYPDPIRDKMKLRHQKNLNCLPIEIADSEERWAIPTDMYYDFKVLRDSAGWVMPYENICFISEHPSEQNFDEIQRLHCETGPAITYPDGFSIYAWRGIVFPQEWLKTKPTASEALKWRNTEQRRVACEMVGWDMMALSR